MPVYPYQCRTCDHTEIHHMPIADYELFRRPECPTCLTRLVRDWDLQIAPVMQEQWAPPVGQAVSNMRQFDDALKAKSDEASERLGYTVNYQQIDPQDTRPAGLDA